MSTALRERGQPQQTHHEGEGVGEMVPDKGTARTWLIRILAVGSILTLLTLGAVAFGAVAIPTVLLGGGLLLLLSPLLLGGAVITSPIWVPIGGLLLTVPPILTALTVAGTAFAGFLYWVYNFLRSPKTKEAAKDLKEGVKEATYCLEHRVYDTCQKAAQIGQQTRARTQESSS